MNPPRLRLALFLLAFAAGLAVGLAVLGRVWPGRSTVTAPAALPIPSAPPRAETAWDPALGSPPRFTDITEAAGIDFRHENGMAGKFRYPEIMGGGVALLDANGDGLLDIYFVNGNRLPPEPLSPKITSRLYRNDGNAAFTDVTARAGVGQPAYGQGACAADYDNDGDIDLHVSNLGPNFLYRNQGDGTFAEVAAQAGVADPGWGQTSSFLDYDGDGWLDLYAQNYLTIAPALAAESFIHVGERRVPDYPSPVGFQGSASRLFRNTGGGKFIDVTVEAGVLREDGKGMGVACADLNDDGRPDIFVANDSMENYYFRNLGGGRFEEVGLAVGLAYDGDGTPEASMGVDVGDHDRDGKMDLVVPCLHRQIYPLYRNHGELFEDVATEAGLGEATARATGFNANFLDYDADGDLDLFFTTGGVRAHETAAPGASYHERYGMEDILLANDGRGRYHDVSRRAGPHFARRTIGRGSAAGDIDGDGDLDLVISNLADRAVVLRNDTRPGNWLFFRLIPAAGNRDALGASVWVEAGGRRQRAIVHGGVTYLSQNDRRLHFGLGTAEKADRVEVLWPSGKREEFRDVPAGRLHTVAEGKGIAGHP
jgi:hypothetical protein